MAIFKMTDKVPNKQLPCTYPECEHQVIVNKFYAPAKARCPEHQGKTAPSIRLAMSGASSSEAVADLTPNRSLGLLHCPMCDTPMQVVQIDEDMGWPKLGCPKCRCAVQIMPRWASLLIKQVHNLPEPMRELIAALNGKQRIKAAEKTG